MKSLSPYAYAAILIIMRLFALSMYSPNQTENPAITAVVTIIFSFFKLLTLIPVIIFFKRNGEQGLSLAPLYKLSSALFLLFSSLLLLSSANSFSQMISSLYPDRFAKISIAATIIFIAAYIASMGLNGIGRACTILSVLFSAFLLFIFVETKSAMLNDRINLYSDDLQSELINTTANISSYLLDYLAFFGLLPYLKNSIAKAAGLYITADCLISILFFLMSASVMGDFWNDSNYSFFTLSFASQGSIIDRSDALALVISGGSALVTFSILLTIAKDSVKSIFKIKSENLVLASIAAMLTIILIFTIVYKYEIENALLIISIISASILFIFSIFLLFSKRKRGESKL